MRVGLVRNVGLSITALAVLALGGCDDNPLNFDVKDTVGIETNPSVMVVSAGRTAELETRAVNQGGEPTFDEISAAVDASCGPATIQIIDVAELEIQPPGMFAVTGGSVLGQTCIALTSGSSSAQVDVTVVANGVEITAPVDGTMFRSGDTGQIVAQLVGLDGAVAGPYDPTLATFASSDTDVIEITDDVGNFTAGQSGSATLTVTWSGDDANGTAGLGVIRQSSVNVTVTAGVPVAAAFENDPLGAFLVGDISEFEVFLVDADGNQNTNETEITGVTVNSSNPAVATASGALVPGGSVHVIVTVEAVGGGSSTISGTVQTTNGDLPFTAEYYVPAPSITSLSASSGVFATTVTITGQSLGFPGLVTSVLVDGVLLGNFTVVSDTEITAQMPTYATASAGHTVVVDVNGISSTEAITWDQTNDCSALDFPEEPGFDGPFVDVSYPLECTGTASGPQDDWFFADVSADAALAGGGSYSVTLTPTWGPPLKDIDFYYDDCTFTVFDFAVDQPPDTYDADLAEGCSLWIMDDYAGFNNGDTTPQPYTITVAP
ncbi:MAG: IPT/TIG domain-containing protein [Candidatus Palauibacterales bacterium]|nr:IPT/TIG domain-containing protein [Candidatus Palauibacterales bacterium]MDP2483962.1 IPT/TIG domain-containing protein [Candidatus Palauibacterales bacterium]